MPGAIGGTGGEKPPRGDVREFTVIREDLEGSRRPPTDEELYPLELLEFGLFGVPLPARFREARCGASKEDGA